MLLWGVAMGAIALQSSWLTFVWLHNGGWKVNSAFFRVSDTSPCFFDEWLAVFVHFLNAWLAGGFPATAKRCLYQKRTCDAFPVHAGWERRWWHLRSFLFQPFEWQNNHLGVHLGGTLLSYFQRLMTNASVTEDVMMAKATWPQLPHYATLRRRPKPSDPKHWQEHMFDSDYLIQLSRRRLVWRN